LTQKYKLSGYYKDKENAEYFKYYYGTIEIFIKKQYNNINKIVLVEGAVSWEANRTIYDDFEKLDKQMEIKKIFMIGTKIIKKDFDILSLSCAYQKRKRAGKMQNLLKENNIDFRKLFK
jgi:hypothetical protein